MWANVTISAAGLFPHKKNSRGRFGCSVMPSQTRLCLLLPDTILPNQLLPSCWFLPGYKWLLKNQTSHLHSSQKQRGSDGDWQQLLLLPFVGKHINFPRNPFSAQSFTRLHGLSYTEVKLGNQGRRLLQLPWADGVPCLRQRGMGQVTGKTDLCIMLAWLNSAPRSMSTQNLQTRLPSEIEPCRYNLLKILRYNQLRGWDLTQAGCSRGSMNQKQPQSRVGSQSQKRQKLHLVEQQTAQTLL